LTPKRKCSTSFVDFLLLTLRFVLIKTFDTLLLFFYNLNKIFMNIYVGNLSYNVRENDLKEAIAEYGQVVSCKLIIDRDTRRSKGFAFVEMSDDEAAKKVIAELNGAEFDGRPMVVKEALPKN
jgi:RNA recognition motif-containing protein